MQNSRSLRMFFRPRGLLLAAATLVVTPYTHVQFKQK